MRKFAGVLTNKCDKMCFGCDKLYRVILSIPETSRQVNNDDASTFNTGVTGR